MKNITRFLLTALVPAMLLGACSDDDGPKPLHDITVTSDTNGTATADKDKAQEGTTVTITATPGTGYLFKEWTVTGGGITLSPDMQTSPATFTMPAGKVSVKAEFIVTYKVTVTAADGGTAIPDKENPKEGETVTVKATPEPGYEFKQWTVTAGGVTLSPDVQTNPATFTMPAGEVSVEAEFLPLGQQYGIETVRIPAGTFQMGSPAKEAKRESMYETQHWVQLTQDFMMSKYEITRRQYAAFLNANNIGQDAIGTVTYFLDGSSHTEEQVFVKEMTGNVTYGLFYNTDKWEPAPGYEDHPMVFVTWYGAKAYADWVGGTLPTEAQWEYACRGNKGTFAFGIGSGGIMNSRMANVYPGSSYSSSTGHTDTGSSSNSSRPVGSYPDYTNSYGLHDMHGNAREWCLDAADYLRKYPTDTSASTPDIDPVGTTGKCRAVRGGSHNIYAHRSRSAARNAYQPTTTLVEVGFRVIFVL